MANKFEDILRSLEPSRKPKSPQECAYCGTTNGLRIYHAPPPGWGRYEVDYVCADCFTGQDDGPYFDDLPEVE